MTYREIAAALWEAGDTQSDIKINSLMDSVQKETGIYPDWDEIPTDWLLAMNGISRRKLEQREEPA